MRKTLQKPFDSRLPANSRTAPPRSKPAPIQPEVSKRDPASIKENHRLTQENARLQEYIQRLEEDLRHKDEFAAILSAISDQKPDSRRTALFKAKIVKQERLVSMLQAALEAQKHLYFEV